MLAVISASIVFASCQKKLEPRIVGLNESTSYESAVVPDSDDTERAWDGTDETGGCNLISEELSELDTETIRTAETQTTEIQATEEQTPAVPTTDIQATDSITEEKKVYDTQNTTEETLAETQTTAPEKVSEGTTASDTVSSLAVKDYLDFEGSSWEREYKPEMIMLHFTSAVVLDKADPYDMSKIRGIFEGDEIGINYIIDRDGTVYCWLPEERCAWHAGRGSLLGYPKYDNNLNRYSIGIELVAIGSENDMSIYFGKEVYDSIADELKGFTEPQYSSLSLLLSDICERYELPRDKAHIIGHSEYSKGKNDPGELFMWDKLMLEENGEKSE